MSIVLAVRRLAAHPRGLGRFSIVQRQLGLSAGGSGAFDNLCLVRVRDPNHHAWTGRSGAVIRACSFPLATLLPVGSTGRCPSIILYCTGQTDDLSLPQGRRQFAKACGGF
jgi:hypothetical protein